MNKFKEKIRNFKTKENKNLSPLAYELPQKTELTEEQKGKYGVLGTDKFEKIEEDEDYEK